MTAEVMTAEAPGNTNAGTSEKIQLRSRAFQFTLNQPEKFEMLRDAIMRNQQLDYFIACKETAPKTGHVHVHIYAHYKSSYKIPQAILKTGVHIEICRGSPKQNIAYIKKGEVIDEFGDEPKQGIKSVQELMQIKKPDELDDWRMFNTWQKIKQMPQKQEVKNWQKLIEVIYICGPSGIGKTNAAEKIMIDKKIEKFEEVKHLGEFWHGIVEGTGCCVYDDFRDSHMCASEFINFIDYRTHNLNVKGGSVRNNYNLIIITSIQRLEDLYLNVPQEAKEQWMRRIKLIDLYEHEAPIEALTL